MKEGIGYTLTLNIAIIFIVIIFTFLSNIVIYYKGYKVSNLITSSIERYEGFNKLSYRDIESKLTSIGYNRRKISCGKTITGHSAVVQIQGYNCVLPLTIDLDEELNSTITNWIDGYQKNGDFDNIDNGDWLASGGNGENGYCIYMCMYGPDSSSLNGTNLSNNEYFYIVKTNMFANIPILNSILNYSVYTDTNILYDFEKVVGTSD